MTSEYNPEIPRHETPSEAIEVAWNNLESEEVPEVLLTLGRSRYRAQLYGKAFLGGRIEVPEEERRQGIGSRLIKKLVEIARARDINQITHTALSEEGLLLIVNALPEKDRKYYDPELEETSLTEALEILKQKKELGKDADDNIAILTDTYIDQLEE